MNAQDPWDRLLELLSDEQRVRLRSAYNIEDQVDTYIDLLIEMLEKRMASEELFQTSCRELGKAALRGETHKREIAKLKLESDRRARNVAERMLALCKANMDGINIEALVDESKI